MKKILTLCVMFLQSILPLLADNITVEEAQNLAQTFLNSQQNTHQKYGAPPSGTQELKLVAQLSDCYIFNKAANTGFVIIANDDIVPQPVLGYADKGSFDTNNMPCNMRWWLSQYAAEMEWARQTPQTTSASSTPAKAPVVSKASIEPLVQSHWNQSAPYNNLCPKQNGRSTYTGCVATATCQIMRYHMHPAQGTGSYSYTWNGQKLTRDFSESIYDWDNMLLDYGSNYTSEQGEAVARLMVDVGYAENMDYSTSGSGTYSSYVATALPTYFGYSNSLQLLKRDSYGLSEWMNKIYDELSSDRPVYYAGYSTDGGHAFVLDGFKQGYFHVNWGWGGVSDGYFLVSALDPDQQGIGGSSSGYNTGQEAIFGIQPKTGDEPAYKSEPDVSIDAFTVPSPSISRSGSFDYNDINSEIWNTSSEALDGFVGLKVKDEQGSVVYLAGSAISVEPGYGTRGNYTVPLSDFPTDKSQTYKVYPAYMTANGDWYDINVSTTTGNKYLEATTDETTIYFKTPTATTPTITATNIILPTKIFSGNTFTVKATIKAKGGEYNGNVYAYSNNSRLATAAVDVDDQTSVTVAFSCRAPSTTGNYTFTIKDKNSNVISSDINFTVEVAPKGNASLSLSSVDFVNTAADDIHLNATFYCKSGYYEGKLLAYIFPENGGSNLATLTSSSSVAVWEGESTVVDFKGAFNGTVGSTYGIMFYTSSSSSTKSIYSWVTFTLTETGTTLTKVTSFDNIGDLIDGAYQQFKTDGNTVDIQNRPTLSNVLLSFNADSNPATVVAVLKNQDHNDNQVSDVKPGYIFVVDESERGLMLTPAANSDATYDLTSLKVGDVLTGALAGNYCEKNGIPAFEVCNSVDNETADTKITYTSDIKADTSGEANEEEEATYPITQIPNIHFLAKTNEKDIYGNENVGDNTKQAYGNYLNTIIRVKGTIGKGKNGEFFLLQNESDTTDVAVASLYRIYITADEFPGTNLEDYVGATGTFDGLLIKRNVTEAKLSAMNANILKISKIYLSESDGEMRVSDLIRNGALVNGADIYLHHTNLVSSDNGYSTICLPFNMTANEFKNAFGCEIETLAEATTTVTSDGAQEFTSINSKNIVAGTPYLLKVTGVQTQGNGSVASESNYWTHIGQKNVNVTEPSTIVATYNDNIVNGEFQFCGLYGKKQYTTGEDGRPTTTLIADNGSQKYQYISSEDGSLRYLSATSALAFDGLRAYYYFPNWDADKNNDTNPGSTKSVLKISVDGKIIDSIDGIQLDNATDSPIYNLQGQKLNCSRSNLPKGLYIQNGTKFAIK